MQPWERIELKLKEIEKKIDEIREDVNSWKLMNGNHTTRNDPFNKTKHES